MLHNIFMKIPANIKLKKNVFNTNRKLSDLNLSIDTIEDYEIVKQLNEIY